MLKFFWDNLDRFKTRYLLLLAVAVLDGLAVFGMPALLTEFTRQSLEARQVYALVVYLCALYFVSLWLSWLTRRYGEALAMEFENYLRFKLYRSYVNLPFLALKDHHSGYFLSLSGKVATMYKLLINMSMWSLARGVTILVFFLVVMARESVVSAVINTVILFIFLALSTTFTLTLAPLQKELSRRYSALAQVFADFLTNVSTVKQLGIYGFAEAKILSGSDIVRAQIRKAQIAHAFKWFLLHGIYGLAFIGTIVYLLWLISEGEVSQAVLIVLVGGFMTIRGNLNSLSEMVVHSFTLKVDIENLREILGPSGGSLLQPTKKQSPVSFQTLEIKEATFKYPGTDKVLGYPDFTLRLGEVICITGESGRGKTSLLNILQGHLALSHGEVLLNGHKVSPAALQDQQGLFIHISQEAELFNLSLHENIAMGQKISRKAVETELQAVNLEDWLLHLDLGLDTIIGEKGTKLSAGQKQRINIVRGLMQSRQVVLLDEPTSHLDAETEGVVVKYLKEKLKHKTAIIITHRKAVLSLASQIISLT